MYAKLARGIGRRPVVVTISWLIIIILCLVAALTGLGGKPLWERLQTDLPQVPGSSSGAGHDIVQSVKDTEYPMQALLKGVDLKAERENATKVYDKVMAGDLGAIADLNIPTAKALHKELAKFNEDLSAMPGVTQAVNPFIEEMAIMDPRVQQMIAQNGDSFLVSVTMDVSEEKAGSAETAKEWKKAVEAKLKTLPEVINPVVKDTSVIVYSQDIASDTMLAQLQKDLIKSEAIGLPLSLIVMILVFGGLLAAAMPLAGAGVAISGALAILLAMTYLVGNQQSFVVNVMSVVGLGLSIDYGLLIVSRFREELRSLTPDRISAYRQELEAKGASAKTLSINTGHLIAMEKTLSTAGRTALFSAVTVVVATACLFVFKPPLMSALAFGGVTVVLLAILAALTLTPALLFLVGDRIIKHPKFTEIPGVAQLRARLKENRDQDKGFFAGIARMTQKAPWLFVVLTLAVLVLLASPVPRLHMLNSSIELIPQSSSVRVFVDSLSKDYKGIGPADHSVVAKASTEELDTWMNDKVSTLEGIGTVRPAHKVGDYAVAEVDFTNSQAGSSAQMDTVKEIRALDSPFEKFDSGQAATQVDFTASLAEGAIPVAVLLAISTLVLLFFLTGSILVPLQALVASTLSLMATIGVAVWIFQDGHLASFFGFTPIGGIESYIIAMVVCFGFGLAMDYQVFLVSRMKERWDQSGDNRQSIFQGLRLAGPIVVSAAAVLVVVFIGFTTGEMIAVKEIGLMLAIMVLIDVAIVRMLLVPSVMNIFGKVNWAAPSVLKKIQSKLHSAV